MTNSTELTRSCLFVYGKAADLEEYRIRWIADDEGVQVIDLKAKLDDFTDDSLKKYFAQFDTPLFMMDSVPLPRLPQEFLKKVTILTSNNMGGPSRLAQFYLLLGKLANRLDLLIPTYAHHGVAGLRQSGASPEEIEYLIDLNLISRGYDLDDVQTVKSMVDVSTRNEGVHCFYDAPPRCHRAVIDRVQAKDQQACIIFAKYGEPVRLIEKARIYSPVRLDLGRAFTEGREYGQYSGYQSEYDPIRSLWRITLERDQSKATGRDKPLYGHKLAEFVAKAAPQRY